MFAPLRCLVRDLFPRQREIIRKGGSDGKKDWSITLWMRLCKCRISYSRKVIRSRTFKMRTMTRNKPPSHINWWAKNVQVPLLERMNLTTEKLWTKGSQIGRVQKLQSSATHRRCSRRKRTRSNEEEIGMKGYKRSGHV